MNNAIRIVVIGSAALLLVAAGCSKKTTNTTSNATSNSTVNTTVNTTVNSSVNTPATNSVTNTVVNTNTVTNTNVNVNVNSSATNTPSVKTVTVTSSGFSPAVVTVKVGDTVTFVNNDSGAHWPASNPHPTHTGLSGFDALRGLTAGQSYSFTFTRVGTFGYHDHLNVLLTGMVIVE